MENNRLKEALANAQLMLEYCAERGMTLPEAHVETIVTCGMQMKNDQDLGSLETKFWMVYANLARLIQPVSVESLKSVRLNDFHAKNRLQRLLGAKSIAHESVNAYRMLGMFVLIVMLLIQIYWVIGAKLVSDISTVIPAELEALRKEKAAKEEALGEKAVFSIEIDDLEAKLIEIGSKLEASAVAVKDWNTVWRVFKFSGDAISSSSQPSDFQDYLEVKYATFALDAMKEYVLPLLYGLLGAFAFVFRDIFTEIKDKTFTPESTIKYVLRLHLGALTGLAVGWFFGDGTTPSSFSISNLSPLALSFLAGYGVEILFSGMDRLIAAFSDASSKKQQPPSTLQPSTLNGSAKRSTNPIEQEVVVA